MDFFDLIQRFLTNRALRSEIADDVCVACDSTDLTFLAEHVYRCNMCGYEGGAGFAEYRDRQKRAGFDGLPPRERHQRAVDKLEEAVTLLTSGQGEVDAALRENRIHSGHDDSNGHQDRNQRMLDAYRLFTEAQTLVGDASYLLGEDFGEVPQLIDDMDATLDFMNGIFDSSLWDLALSQKLERARSDADQLLRLCQKTLAQARKQSPAAQPDEGGGVW